MKKMLQHAILAACLFALPWGTRALAEKPAGFDSGLQLFVQQMADEHDFDRDWLRETMQQIVYRQDIIDAISRPAEAKPWHQYRPIFVTQARATEGAAFWEANASLLQRAEAEYGVPAEIIVAIIGVETRYGRHKGKYPVLDALGTLAFGYPKRSRFFRSELEQFLLLAREEQVDPTVALGSYAGAMGQPQFIASSYRNYAVDFDGDGRRDLQNSTADSIGSVAAYFKRHGWRRGAPVTSRARGVGREHRHFIEAGMKPSLTIGELAAAGIEPELDDLPADAMSSLIELQGTEASEYWLGLDNFYVITRYNHSNLYAMAVYQLSREILALREQRG